MADSLDVDTTEDTSSGIKEEKFQPSTSVTTRPGSFERAEVSPSFAGDFQHIDTGIQNVKLSQGMSPYPKASLIMNTLIQAKNQASLTMDEPDTKQASPSESVSPIEALSLVSPPSFVAGTQFVSETPKDELWGNIQDFLNDHKGVDYVKEIKQGSDSPEDQKGSDSPEGVQVIYAVCHSLPSDSSIGSCQFNVQIFSQPKEGTVLVEFQQLSGCGWTFNDLYYHVEKDLQTHFLDYQVSGRKYMNNKLPNQTEILLDDETFGHLYKMANSEILEASHEGIINLAKFSYSTKNQEFFQAQSSPLTALIKKSLANTGDYVLHQSSTVLAANLSTQEKFIEPLRALKDQFKNIYMGNGIASDSNEDYARVYNLYLVDMKRQIEKALENLDAEFLQSMKSQVE